MARVRILISFTGFPDGTGESERLFREGETADDLPEEFAALIVAKGHAVEADMPDGSGSPIDNEDKEPAS